MSSFVLCMHLMPARGTYLFPHLIDRLNAYPIEKLCLGLEHFLFMLLV